MFPIGFLAERDVRLERFTLEFTLAEGETTTPLADGFRRLRESEMLCTRSVRGILCSDWLRFS